MEALVKAAPGEGMETRDVPEVEPGPTDVKIAVESVGIDGGAEALIYDWDESWHHLSSELPRIFGHEFAGRVAEVGSAVTDVRPGTRVAVEPGITCGTCRNCLAGEPNICDERELVGIDRDGALAEYVVVPVRNVYEIPDDLGFDEAAYLEVLALGVNAVEYSAFRPGDRVAITGPGPVGLGVLVAVAAGGAETIDVAGAPIDAGTRLPVAEAVGASRTLVLEDGGIDREADVSFEASGHPSALEALVGATRRGGGIVQIGLFHGRDAVPVDLNHLVDNGISYRPIRARRDSSWRRAIAIARATDLSPIVGPTFEMADYEAAFAAARNRDGVKITLHP